MRTVTYGDGTRHVYAVSGSVVEVRYPICVFTAHGELQELVAPPTRSVSAPAIAVATADDGVQRWPDGTSRRTHGDGTVVTHFPDGSVETQARDCVVRARAHTHTHITDYRNVCSPMVTSSTCTLTARR